MRPTASFTLASTRDMTPVIRSMSTSPVRRGVTPSGIECQLCHLGCEAISDPLAKQACHIACQQIVC